MTSYVPHTQEEKQEILASMHLNSMEELFCHIPEQVRLKELLQIPLGKSEMEVKTQINALAQKNKVFPTIFRGAGAYRHFIPAVVKQMASREEFVTAYTPYQAEISQGILQSIFEYQTMICSLTGMDAANASVYDGATAAAEAMNMCRSPKKKKVLIAATANPQVIATMQTYAYSFDMEIGLIPQKNGKTDLTALSQLLDDSISCVYIASPNYYGQIEDCGKIAQLIHAAGSIYIAGCNPISLGLLQTPAAMGADIAVGEGQPLGLPLGFGGPYLGFMACKSAMMRKLPGRIVGQTVDADGKTAYVLTLQAREQHIRREKAASNICSNQALCALTAGIYLAAMGPNGLKEVANLCLQKAHYAATEMQKISGFQLVYDGPFFHEFVTKCPIPVEKVMTALEEKNILGGLPLNGALDNCILWCFTECNSKEEIDTLIQILKEVT